MASGDCPQCDHARCIECDVKSHIATEAEEDKESKKKIERPAVLNSRSVLGENEARSSNSDECGELE